MWKKLIVALDVSDPRQALDLVSRLRGEVGIFKVGLQLFTACGPDIVRRIRDLESDVFLDLKLHDIPNTVRQAVREASRLDVAMLTLHTFGGEAMLRAAVDAIAESAEVSHSSPKLLGVTVLTSLKQADLSALAIAESLDEMVVSRARLAARVGLQGVVASPREISLLRQADLQELLIVTPGIRPAGAGSDDQARTATPAAAVAEGADYLVVGRPITRSQDPVKAARQICLEMERGKIGEA